ncbi:hypothetical protein [Chelativorans sp. M5D2P16]|uniref:hypothetical protein n=1 Tax=Chelativorans sp. M5D2P16 TaxID=3095678 RepID=UPI002ACAE8F8|nr:hypothetical protein [Chelativorans sp. M5D2P16]MDZ5698365.1 hypothetical protein [Chelativorans sp. M5D2P16]
MATIFSFKPDHTPARARRALPAGGAEVIIFPGVRYERVQSAACKKVSAGPRSAKRRKKR